jgi:hypothetical protein
MFHPCYVIFTSLSICLPFLVAFFFPLFHKCLIFIHFLKRFLSYILEKLSQKFFFIFLIIPCLL